MWDFFLVEEGLEEDHIIGIDTEACLCPNSTGVIRRCKHDTWHDTREASAQSKISTLEAIRHVHEVTVFLDQRH